MELTRFEATLVEGKGPANMGTDASGASSAVRLSWRTASEPQNARFEVQRRTGDARSWQTVGHRAGAGTTTRPQTYQLVDRSLPYAADSVRYRLRQVDTDGSTSLTDPVTVARSRPAALALQDPYPNPVRDQAVVQYKIPQMPDDARATIRLYDMLGREVRSIVIDGQPGRRKRTLDTSRLSPGVYVLRLTVAGQTQSETLTVVR